MSQVFKFIRVLTTEPDAATIFYGMDDESNNYMMEQFIAAEHLAYDSNYVIHE
ncbi:hypothetical protein V7S43_012388 [Phytophthora oleae]|uniref:Uncharacterized protein n=1 Tax=Phytophthora oleae TaxID=2107226 RepID=A0ABD3F732_9STRA